MNIKTLFHSHKAKGFTFADQAILSGTSFLITIILTRLLGLSQVGIYTLIWILVLFAQSLHQAGIISPMLVFGARNMSDNKRVEYFSALFGVHFVFIALIALGTGLFMHFYLQWYPETHLHWIRIKLPLLIILVLNNDFFRKRLYMKEQHYKAALVDGLSYAGLIAALLIGGGRKQLSLDLVFSFMLMAQLCASVLFLILSPLRLVSKEALYKVLQQHWDYSLWLLLAAVFQWFAGNVLLLVAGRYLSMELLGALRIMQNLMGVLNVVLLSFESYIPVSASRIFSHAGHSAMFTYLKGTLKKAVMLFAAPLLFFYFFPEFIIRISYGAVHVDYAYLLKAYSLLYIFIILGMILRIGLRVIEKTRAVFFSYLLTASVSAAIAKPLVVHLADLGVIVGLLVAQVVMLAYYAFLLYQESKGQKLEEA